MSVSRVECGAHEDLRRGTSHESSSGSRCASVDVSLDAAEMIDSPVKRRGTPPLRFGEANPTVVQERGAALGLRDLLDRLRFRVSHASSPDTEAARRLRVLSVIADPSSSTEGDACDAMSATCAPMLQAVLKAETSRSSSESAPLR